MCWYPVNAYVRATRPSSSRNGPHPQALPPPRGKGEDPRAMGWSTRVMGVRRKKNAFSPKRLDTIGPFLRTRLSTLPPRRGKGRGWGPRAAPSP